MTKKVNPKGKQRAYTLPLKDGIEEYIRRKEVAKMYYEDEMSQGAIAKELGITQPAVSLQLKKMERIWQYDHAEIVEAAKQVAIDFHQNIIVESMAAWYDSIGDVFTKSEGTDRGSETDLVTTSISHGDVSYLKTAQASEKAIRDIMGYAAPSKHAVANFNYDVDLSKFTPEMLRRVRDDGVSPVEIALEYSEYAASDD